MNDSKAKLQQVNQDIEALKANKRAIEKEIAEAEVTYSIGDRFRLGSDKRILVRVENMVSLISLSDGSPQAYSIKACDSRRITQAEFDNMRKYIDYVRYYDSRKQVRV